MRENFYKVRTRKRKIIGYCRLHDIPISDRAFLKKKGCIKKGCMHFDLNRRLNDENRYKKSFVFRERRKRRIH